MALQVCLLSPDATAPYRASVGAAGYDLFSAYDVTIPARDRLTVKTDIAISIPDDCYAQVSSRSSLALKKIDIGAGVIDSDYRGNVGIVVINHGDTPFTISMGDRIAQLILHRIETPVVSVVEHLKPTSRNEGGFGSTGV